MKKRITFILTLILWTMSGHAEEEELHLFNEETSVKKAKASEEDPNINASAATLEAGPSAIVAGCVNAITGTYFDSAIDLALPGPQPLLVQRTFCSFHLGKYEPNFLHKSHLEVAVSEHHVYASYFDDNGSGLPYKARLDSFNEPKENLKLTSKALENLTNTSGNEISCGTKWGNSHIDFVRAHEEKQYHLKLGSSTTRIYERYKRKGEKHKSGASAGKFHITEEWTPNNNKYLYQYNEDDELITVQATNGKGTVLGELTHKEQQHEEVWSLGTMSVTYNYNFDGLNGLSIKPSHSIPSWYQWSSSGERFGKLLQKNLPDKRALQIKYSYGAVLTLLAPVSSTEALIPIYTFNYVTAKHKNDSAYTNVRDAEGRLVEYEYEWGSKKLRSITKYSEGNQQFCKEKFYWNEATETSECTLKTKRFEGDGICHFCRQFRYDKFGNVTKEHLWGNLTGHNTQPVVINDGTPQANGCECYTKTFQHSQDKRNLLTYEDDGSKWLCYTYYPNTNRVATRFTGTNQIIFKREFFNYDANGVLIEEIWDDGYGSNKNDLSGVTERHIRVTIPLTEFPIGLPYIVQEFYLDLSTHTQHLLKQTVNTHSLEGKILQQQHYDCNSNLAYTPMSLS